MRLDFDTLTTTQPPSTLAAAANDGQIGKIPCYIFYCNNVLFFMKRGLHCKWGLSRRYQSDQCQPASSVWYPHRPTQQEDDDKVQIDRETYRLFLQCTWTPERRETLGQPNSLLGPREPGNRIWKVKVTYFTCDSTSRFLISIFSIFYFIILL